MLICTYWSQFAQPFPMHKNRQSANYNTFVEQIQNSKSQLLMQIEIKLQALQNCVISYVDYVYSASQ